MAIRTFKEIIDNKGYRIDSNDRQIFENDSIESFFGLSANDVIEFHKEQERRIELNKVKSVYYINK
jgi:hypothetical protein